MTFQRFLCLAALCWAGCDAETEPDKALSGVWQAPVGSGRTAYVQIEGSNLEIGVATAGKQCWDAHDDYIAVHGPGVAENTFTYMGAAAMRVTVETFTDALFMSASGPIPAFSSLAQPPGTFTATEVDVNRYTFPCR